MLDLDLDTLAERRKDQTMQNLKEQCENYKKLTKLIKPIRVKSKGDINKNIYKLVEVTWSELFKRLRY